MTTRHVTLIGALILATGPLLAQVPRAPAIPTAPIGTAELLVTVLSDDSANQPLRRVSVGIQAAELDVPNIGVTDDEGRVAFRNLPPGNYLVTAMRAGYVRTFYGSSLPGRGPGLPVSVLEGQKVSGVQIRMLRGSVITGLIRTASGQPAPNRQVQAIMVRATGGAARAINVESGIGSAVTDDRGVYRIFGLAPGDYLVSVPATGVSEELRPMTAAELQWADRVVAGGSVPAPSVIGAPAGAPTITYAPVYYPGTAVATDAAAITLGAAEERTGVDFALQFVAAANVSGRVVDADGRPQDGLTVSLQPVRLDGLDLFAVLFNARGYTVADGTFSIPAVKPGAYTLIVRAAPRSGAEPSAGTGVPGPPAATTGAAGTPAQWASEQITVSGRDVSDVTLTLRPGATVTGHIVYDATTKTPPVDLSKTPLALLPAPTGTGLSDLVGALTGSGSMPPAIGRDGIFSFRGVAPGRYRLNTPLATVPLAGMSMLSAGGWTLKSVMAGGRDIADATLDILPGADVSGIVVTFTDRPSEIAGTVFDAAGRATPGFPIVVFSTDRANWTIGSRRVQTVRPSSDGRYKIVGLPAGEYFLCSVTTVDRTELYDSGFLEPLSGIAFKIVIADGEKKTQDLKLGGR